MIEMMTFAELTERLKLLSQRLSDEGRYVDSDIVAEAEMRIIEMSEEICLLEVMLKNLITELENNMITESKKMNVIIQKCIDAATD